MRANRLKKGKKGFSLLETTIAMALIALVFAMALSTVLLATSVRTRARNRVYFVEEVSNYLTCYQMEGVTAFQSNVERYLQVPITIQDNTVKIYYTKEYSKTSNVEKASFILTLDLNGGFYAWVEDLDGKRVFAMNERFVTRFDAGGAE